MMMIRRWILVLIGMTVGCGGGAGTPGNAAGEPVGTSDPGAPRPPAAAPLLPAVEGEIIGFPGADVPGLDATYVTTGLGWLGADDDVVFEGVIQWRATLELGCGILRRRADGSVNAVLMQGQLLPGTGGGRVKHPQLPLEARGETLVIPALVDGGTIVRGLFAVPRGGGAPRLLAAETTGEFVAAEITDDGTVVAEVEEDAGTTILVIPRGGAPDVLCAGCAPGFSTDGACVVVRQADRAVAFELDGTPHPLLGAGDPAPGAQGLVTGIRAAWVTAGGDDFVVQAATDDPDRPDVLVRLRPGGTPEVVAACGAPAPGTAGVFEAIRPAAGRSADVVFGATVAGDPTRPTAVYCAPPGRPAALLAATGDAADDIDAFLAIGSGDVVAGDGGRTAFGAYVYRDGVALAEGVFVADGGGTTRIVTTGAPVAGRAATTVARFQFPLRDAVDVAGDGRTLVHVGLAEERRPDATLGALLLVR